ncbi:MAG: hypothetical protein JWO10_1948 [Microbacteriaceae bacterium]|nr:hypothetical protein [Microbacteriaceae bacterium]
MELLFAVLGGAVLGLGARYVLPGRDSYGVGLLPAVGAVAASIIWAALTWAGWKFDGGWIWVVTLVVAAIAAIAVGLQLPRARRKLDDELLVKLNRA